MARAPDWTEAENEIVRTQYLALTTKQLTALLPGRTRYAIATQAFKLGVRKRGQSPTCHPERPLYAKGLCAQCYKAERRAAGIEHKGNPERFARYAKSEKGKAARRRYKAKVAAAKPKKGDREIALEILETRQWVTPATLRQLRRHFRGQSREQILELFQLLEAEGLGVVSGDRFTKK